nr:hypothetical protein B0A51_01169 [Rachicladosporium sp. CCFEE 5018]
MRTPKRMGDKPNHKRRQPWIAPLARPRFDSKPALSPATQTKQVARIEISPAVERKVDPPVDPALSTAATQVFSIVELAEQILVMIDWRQLFILQSVNRDFQAIIKGPTKLRARMFLPCRPVEPNSPLRPATKPEHSRPTLNPFAVPRSRHHSLFAWLGPFAPRYHYNSASSPAAEITLKLLSASSYPKSTTTLKAELFAARSHESWRKMLFVVDSNLRVGAKCRLVVPRGYQVGDRGREIHEVVLERECTIGEAVDAIVRELTSGGQDGGSV